MRSRKRATLVPEDLNLSGKTVLITGANTGLGLEAARQFLLAKTSTLVITARSSTKCAETLERLRSDPAISALSPNPQILTATLSLEEYDSVKTFVTTLNTLVDRLDVVVHNAGVGGSRFWETSKEGHEMIFQVDYLSPAYLTLALLPLLRKSASLSGAPARYTWIGSYSGQTRHTFAAIPPDTEPLFHYFNDRDRQDWMWRYQNAKALASWFIADLADRVDSSEVILTTVCPGAVSGTNIDRTQTRFIWVASFLVKRFSRSSISEGVRRYLHASVVVGPEMHGKFLTGYVPSPLACLPSAEKNKQMRRMAWDETLAEIQRLDPAIAVPP